VIVQYLEVLDTCQNAGPKVVATVLDMGASSVKALKVLGVTKRKPPFRFDNQEIAMVYDPPHLLKCIQNLFLKHYVQLNSELLDNQLPVIANWDHMLKYMAFLCKVMCVIFIMNNSTFKKWLELILSLIFK
jgi:hypothetical protein